MADDISVLTKDTDGTRRADARNEAPLNAPNKGLDIQQDPEEIARVKLQAKLDIRKDKAKLMEAIKTMTHEEIFMLFDDDDSGLISFNEFREVLPFLGVVINDAKAYRYFALCDTNGTGHIDVDEFKVALFACDPSAGNPTGFAPSKLLTPLDAFETFDEDGIGYLDEDEFFYAMEYLHLKLSDYHHEKHFKKIDINNSESIDYIEFREVFLEICDVKEQLEERGVEVPTFAWRSTLVKILREMLNEEEDRERRALAETRRYKEWIFSNKNKKRYLRRAQWRAYTELRAAMDAAGQVYVFGTGTHGQFAQESLDTINTRGFTFEHFEKIKSLWNDRVNPEQMVDRLKLSRRADEQEERRYEAKDPAANRMVGALTAKEQKIDPYEIACLSPFRGLTVSTNTAVLWAKRIHHVTVSESVIFAMSDSGSIFCWGGNNFFWHEIQPDSIYQTKWRGDITPRSQILLGVQNKELPADAASSMDLVGDIEGKSEEERKVEIIKTVTKYYDVWEPPPSGANRMHYLEKELLMKVEYDRIKFSLECRGKEVGDIPKFDLVEEIFHDIVLEKRLLGERAHKAIKELEAQVQGLRKRRKFVLADQIKENIENMWEPLREVQAEKRAKERAEKQAQIHNKVVKIENSYIDYRHRVQEKSEDINPEFTARGNSLAIDLHGITPRGPQASTPRAYQGGSQISAGAAHVCLIHKSGQLYAWGLGGSGRLGLDMSEKGDPQIDVAKPTLVQSLAGRPVVKVSCGYNHTGCIVSGGDLYMWGSASNGKCGLAEKDILVKQECFCPIPTKVMVGLDDRRVRKISCGSAHTGVVTEQGHLYMFGLGDGGRLGFGEGCYDMITFPKLVESLLHEKIASVSCGNTSTIVLTEIRMENQGENEMRMRVTVGGKVYIAGSGNVFDKQYPKFTYLKSMAGKPVKQASAGFQHSTLVTADGELYCWGRNNNCCCGTAPQVKFIEHPLPVVCLFQNVINLALGCPATQSSTYNSKEATLATDGNTNGNGKNCTHTQQDPQPWLEIDLGQFALIDEIRLWNRTDTPKDVTEQPDKYRSRLFPCWVMIGQDPFGREETSTQLSNNLNKAVAKVKFTEDLRMSSWRCPANTQGRYVRVQLEGYNYLHIAQVEVMGNWGLSNGVGRVSYACAGRDVTVAVIRPKTDPIDIESMYKRAVYADSLNADILRQYDTYALEYDKYGRGEVLKKCIICRGTFLCEICVLKQQFQADIAKMPPQIGGRRPTLDAIEDYLLNHHKPKLEIPELKRHNRPTWWDDFKVKYKPLLNPANWFRRAPVVFPMNRDYEKSTMLMNNTMNGRHMTEDRDFLNSVLHKRAASISEKADVDGDSSIASESSQIPSNSVTSKYTIGETLPTGHIVRNPYPDSLGDKIDESREILRNKKREKIQAKKKKRREAGIVKHV